MRSGVNFVIDFKLSDDKDFVRDLISGSSAFDVCGSYNADNDVSVPFKVAAARLLAAVSPVFDRMTSSS